MLAGMAMMAALVLWWRVRGCDAALAPALQMLAAFVTGLAIILVLDPTPLSEWEVLILPSLPLLLARHIEALVVPRPLRKRDVIFAASGLLYLPYLLAPVSARDAMAEGALPALALPITLAILLGVVLFWLTLIGMTLMSGWRIAQAMRAHRARLAQVIATPASHRMGGVALLGFFMAVVFGFQLLDLVTLRGLWPGIAVDGFVLLVILGLTLHGLTLRQTLPDWAGEIVDLVQTGPKTEGDARPSYTRSGLDAAAIKKLLMRLDDAMRRASLWRQPGLSLADLAHAVGAKTFYVSQALNQGREESFFDYVNRWRVIEAQALLHASDASVITIAYDVGFNAKSTFNAAFRKVTGMTPSVWRTSGPVGAVAPDDRD